VASGGTDALIPPTAAPPTGLFTPQQKMILAITLSVLSPGILATLGGIIAGETLAAPLAAISAVLMPIAVMLSIFYFKAQLRRQAARHDTPPVSLDPPSIPASPPQSGLPPRRTNPLADSAQPGFSVVEDETRRLSRQG